MKEDRSKLLSGKTWRDYQAEYQGKRESKTRKTRTVTKLESAKRKFLSAVKG